MAKFFGVGVGPGDPELVTLKAAKVLQNVSVVCVPLSRKGRSSLAYSIAQEHISPRAEIVELLLPMSKDKQELKTAWQKVAGQISVYLRAGRDTAFITLGDPSLFSTFSYVNKEVKKLLPAIEVEIIPGITAFSASAARIGCPLAEGDESLTINPGGDKDSLKKVLNSSENIVMMKISMYYEWLVEELRRNGRLQTSFLVSRCGLPEEVVTGSLTSIDGSNINYLSLIMSKRAKEDVN